MAIIIGAMGIMWLAFWGAYLVVGLRFAWSNWKVAEVFTGWKRHVLRLSSAALIFQVVGHTAYSLVVDGLLEAIKVFAAVGTVAAENKNTILSAGIAEVGNVALYNIMTALPLPAVLIIAIIVMRKVWAP